MIIIGQSSLEWDGKRRVEGRVKAGLSAVPATPGAEEVLTSAAILSDRHMMTVSGFHEMRHPIFPTHAGMPRKHPRPAPLQGRPRMSEQRRGRSSPISEEVIEILADGPKRVKKKNRTHSSARSKGGQQVRCLFDAILYAGGNRMRKESLECASLQI